MSIRRCTGKDEAILGAAEHTETMEADTVLLRLASGWAWCACDDPELGEIPAHRLVIRITKLPYVGPGRVRRPAQPPRAR